MIPPVPALPSPQPARTDGTESSLALGGVSLAGAHAPTYRVLTPHEFEGVALKVSRQSREDARLWEVLLETMSVEDLSTAAIALAMVRELGEVFELPKSQWVILFAVYLDGFGTALYLVMRETI